AVNAEQFGSTPAHGNVSVNANGSFVYTPTSNYIGSDSFGYRFTDGQGATSNTATVTITLVDNAPRVTPETYRIPHGVSTFSPPHGVLDNDSDEPVDIPNLTAQLAGTGL